MKELLTLYDARMAIKTKGTVLVFTNVNCPQCDRAKMTLSNKIKSGEFRNPKYKDYNFVYVVASNPEFRPLLIEYSIRGSVPQFMETNLDGLISKLGVDEKVANAL